MHNQLHAIANDSHYQIFKGQKKLGKCRVIGSAITDVRMAYQRFITALLLHGKREQPVTIYKINICYLWSIFANI